MLPDVSVLDGVFIQALKIWDPFGGNTWITGNPGKSLQRAHTKSSMAVKLKERKEWEHAIFNNIDWHSQEMVIKGMKDNDKNRYS